MFLKKYWDWCVKHWKLTLALVGSGIAFIIGYTRANRNTQRVKLDLEIKTRDQVCITSHHNGRSISASNWAVIPYKIPKRNIATYFPEANELVPLESTADISNTPTSKWIICTISGQNSANEEE